MYVGECGSPDPRPYCSNNGGHEELEERAGDGSKERSEGPCQGTISRGVPRRIDFCHGRENKWASHLLGISRLSEIDCWGIIPSPLPPGPLISAYKIRVEF
jgi:hypothetical protein